MQSAQPVADATIAAGGVSFSLVSLLSWKALSNSGSVSCEMHGFLRAHRGVALGSATAICSAAPGWILSG